MILEISSPYEHFLTVLLGKSVTSLEYIHGHVEAVIMKFLKNLDESPNIFFC